MAGRFFLEHLKRFQGDVTGEMRSTGLKLLGYLDEQRKLSGITTNSKTIKLPDGSTITAAWHGNTPILTINAVSVSVSSEEIPTDLYAYISNYPRIGDITVYNLTKETNQVLPREAFVDPNQIGFFRKDVLYKGNTIAVKAYDPATKTRLYKLKLGKLVTGPVLLYPAGAANDFGFGELDAAGNFYYYDTDAPGHLAAVRKLSTNGVNTQIANTAAFGSLHNLTVKPDGSRVYVCNYNSNRMIWMRSDFPDGVGNIFADALGAPHPLSGPWATQISRDGRRLYVFSVLNSRLHAFNTVDDELNRVGVYAPGYNCAQAISISYDETFAVMHAGNGSAGGTTTTVVNIDEASAAPFTGIKAFQYKHPDPLNAANQSAITTGSNACDVGPDNLIYTLSQRTSAANLDLYLSVFRADAASSNTPVKHIRLGPNSGSGLTASAHSVVVTTKFPYKPSKVT